MPNRILRDGILTSEAVDRLSVDAELFYRRVLSVVDDFGRYFAKPELLRGACYPLRIDRVSNKQIILWLRECEKAQLIQTYQVAGTPYLAILKFQQRLRIMRSKFPDSPPQADSPHLSDTCQSDDRQMAGISQSHAPGGGGGGGGEKNKTRPSAGSFCAKPVENPPTKDRQEGRSLPSDSSPTLKAELQRVFEAGLNVYALLNRVQTELKRPASWRFPEEVLLGVCAAFTRERPAIRDPWPWFVTVLERESKLYNARQNIHEHNQFRQTAVSLEEILRRALAAAQAPGPAQAVH